MSTGIPWTAEDRTLLAEMVAAGATGSEIGNALGRSRNAVLGHCHREKIRLEITERKRAIGRRRFKSPKPKGEQRSKFGPDHPARLNRPFGARAFPDAQIAVAIAARLAGMSRQKASHLIGAGPQSLKNWERKPDLLALGRALFERAHAEAAEKATKAHALAASCAEAARLRVEQNNEPILAAMRGRDRVICQMRIAGDTLEVVGAAFGITRERVRQVEARYRVAGLIVPGARELSEASRRTFAPKAPRLPRPQKPSRRREPMDFWAMAQDMATDAARKVYLITPEERDRRSDWMRTVNARRRERSGAAT